MKLSSSFSRLAGPAVFVLLSACGGGGGGGDDPMPPRVDTVSALDPVLYGNALRFAFDGANLDDSVSVSATGACTALEVTSRTATQINATCTPSRTGDLVLSALNSANSTLAQETLVVPKPQVRVDLNGSNGSFTIELEPNAAPLTVNNLLQYVGDGFYSNTLMHRIVRNFVVQGGGFDATTGQQKTTRAPIVLELPATTGLSNTQYTVAMARTNVLNSATSQFYVNSVNNASSLDTGSGGYAVFGRLVSGQSVIDALNLVDTNSNGVPITPVVITSATRIR